MWLVFKHVNCTIKLYFEVAVAKYSIYFTPKFSSINKEYNIFWNTTICLCFWLTLYYLSLLCTSKTNISLCFYLNRKELSMCKLLNICCFVQWHAKKKHYANSNWIMISYLIHILKMARNNMTSVGLGKMFRNFEN